MPKRGPAATEASLYSPASGYWSATIVPLDRISIATADLTMDGAVVESSFFLGDAYVNNWLPVIAG
jgi:hypothetical protein